MANENRNDCMPVAEDAGFVEERDVDLEQALRGAYESIDPTSEQEERMLKALLEAQSAKAGAAVGAPTGAQAEQTAAEAMPEFQAAAEEASAEAQAAATAASAAADEASAEAQAAATAASAAADEATVEAQVAATAATAATEATAATAATAAAAATPAKSQATTPVDSQATTPAANRAHAFKAWKVAVPLAACLALGAVVIGVSGAQQPSVNVAQDPTATQTTEATTKTEPAQTDVLETEAATADGTAMGAYAYEEVEPVSGFYYDDIDFNTEEYSALKETGFVSTKGNPLSTVSADVDTASYCNLRRMIEDGYSLSDVPTGAVRIEEMLNYFDYDYATPAGGELFSMQAQAATCPWNKDTQLLVMGFAAAPESQAESKGSNLVFLVDVSGSMDSPDKLDLLQDSFATLLDNLDSNDRVSIVTYASGEEIVLEGASGDDDKAILKAIYKLQADGSTNGEAGLEQAYRVAERNYIEGGVNRIIMASDGDLNVGMTSESDLYDYVDGKRDTGIYLSVLGFGSGNYKDNKMETLADHGNGSYHYIDCIEEAERVLKDKLTANLVPFADDVKIQVEFNPAQVKAYRLIGYENRELADEDFRNDEVDAGDVGPGAQFTVAYEIVPADSSFEVAEPDLKYGSSAQSYGSDSSDWLTCTMRYHEFDGDKMSEQQLTVDANNLADQPDANWNLAAAVIEFGMLARDSEYAGTSSEDGILDLLTGVANNEQADSFRKLVVTALD